VLYRVDRTARDPRDRVVPDRLRAVIENRQTTLGMHILRIPLPKDTPGGSHVITASSEVSLQVSGYGFATSYQYPGGLNLKNIAEPLPPLL
jgi:hypothetical protein